MESQELATAQNLRAHVEWLAGQIGERNIFRPQALQNAAEYIESQWRRQGYAVERFGYEVSGIRCFNLPRDNQREKAASIWMRMPLAA